MREIEHHLLPVVETFGPTIQGEGPEAGMPCCFIRFGGCDYRCSWCDSMYAVEPAEVKKAEKLTVAQILERLPDVPRVILSGGNPALLPLKHLVEELQVQGRSVSIETQGSRWRPWLGNVDKLIVSPKPPSSGMASEAHSNETAHFLDEAAVCQVPTFLKVVVFDDADFEWSKRFLVTEGIYKAPPLFLSAGTPQRETEAKPVGSVLPDTVVPAGAADASIVDDVIWRYRWLCEKVARDPAMHNVRVLPQLHVLAWGTVRGV